MPTSPPAAPLWGLLLPLVVAGRVAWASAGLEAHDEKDSGEVEYMDAIISSSSCFGITAGAGLHITACPPTTEGHGFRLRPSRCGDEHQKLSVLVHMVKKRKSGGGEKEIERRESGEKGGGGGKRGERVIGKKSDR